MTENNHAPGTGDRLIAFAFAVLSICLVSFLISPLIITAGKFELGGIIGLTGLFSGIIGAVLMFTMAFVVLPKLHRSAGDYFTLLKLPAVLIAANAVAGLLLSHIVTAAWADILFNVIRAAVVAYAGWVLVRRGRFSVWKAALAGLLLLFIDHPIIGSAAFLVQGQWMAVGGVFLSFVMFSAVPMLVGLLGGMAGRKGCKTIR